MRGSAPCTPSRPCTLRWGWARAGPPQPLLWRHCGRPGLPPSLALDSLLDRVLADLAGA